MPFTLNWLQYAENRLAPLRRKRSGSNMPKTAWLLYAENPVAPLRRKMTAGQLAVGGGVTSNYKWQRTGSHRGRTVRAIDGARGPVRKHIVARRCTKR